MTKLSDGARWKGQIGEALSDLFEDIEYAPQGTAAGMSTVVAPASGTPAEIDTRLKV